jgi:hypothetical protein
MTAATRLVVQTSPRKPKASGTLGEQTGELCELLGS